LPSTQLHKHKGGSSPAACKVHEPSPIGVTHSTPICSNASVTSDSTLGKPYCQRTWNEPPGVAFILLCGKWSDTHEMNLHSLSNMWLDLPSFRNTQGKA
jgi:hypothetical protein